MPSVHCPGCDEKVKVYADEERVRCPSCGYKFRVDEDDDEDMDDRPRPKRNLVKKKSGKPFLEEYKEVLSTAAGALVLSVLILLVAFCLPKLLFVAVIGALLIYVYSFVRTCILASGEGNFISIDYLESLGFIRVPLIFMFCYMYVFGYFVMWYVVQVGCAIGKPKKFLPWLGLEAYGVLLVIVTIIAAAVGQSVQEAGRQVIRNHQPPKGFEDPLPFDDDPPFVNPPIVKPPEPPPVPRVTGDGMLDPLLADLTNPNTAVVCKAADDLAKLTPNQHRATVARKIAEQLRTAHPFSRSSLIRALGVWGTPAETPALVQVLNENDVNARTEVMQAVVRHKLRDPQLAQQIARNFTTYLSDRFHGEAALTNMGPVAEDAVLSILEHPNQQMHPPAVRMLAKVGTAKSLPTLQRIIDSKNVRLLAASRQAVQEINARITRK